MDLSLPCCDRIGFYQYLSYRILSVGSHILLIVSSCISRQYSNDGWSRLPTISEQLSGFNKRKCSVCNCKVSNKLRCAWRRLLAAWAGAIKGKCRSSRVSVRPSNERTCPVSTTALCICTDQSVRILHKSFLRNTGYIFAFDWKTAVLADRPWRFTCEIKFECWLDLDFFSCKTPTLCVCMWKICFMNSKCLSTDDCDNNV